MPIFTMAIGLLVDIGLSTFFATTIVSSAVGIVASIGLSYAAKALSGTPAAADTTSHFSAQGTLQSGGDVPRSFNLGYSSTAGSLAYVNTWGVTGGSTKTPNAYLTQVIALADLPGGSLTEVWINGVLCTLGVTAETTFGMGFPVTQYNKAGVDHLWIKFHNGTQTTADSFLTTSVNSTAYPYQSTRVGTGVAYVICTSLVEDTLFTGFPTFKFALSGIPLYDPSQDSTVGGSGSQVYSTPSTWGGDGDNLPAVQIYNLIRGFSYNGVWFYGLQNMTAARLPVANWITQIGKCRTTITGTSGLEATYRSGGQININAPLADAVEAVLTACAGRLSEVGGFYKIHVGTPDSSSFSFSDDNILSTEEQHFTPFFPLANSTNGIAASYPSPAQGWNTTVAPPYYRTDLELLDGNRRLMANPAFDFVPYDAQVQRLMKSAILEAQRARRHTIVLPAEYWTIEPGDVGSWTSVRNGYSSKQFRVDGIIDRGNLDVIVTITEVDPADYSWTHSIDFTSVSFGPSVFSAPFAQDIGSFTAVGVILYDSNGVTRRPAIQLGWDGTQSGVAGVQYEVRLQSSAVVVSRGGTSQYAIGALIISESLLPNQIYEVRGQYIPTWPRQVNWSSWIAVTTPNVLYSLAEFDAAVTAQVTVVTDYLDSQLNAVTQLIASGASNDMATNWLDKQQVRSEVSSVVGAANASIVTLSNTQVSDQIAFASYQTTVSASFDAASASVTTFAAAIATLNGYAAASYSVTLDVNGYATGFELLNGGFGVSSFTITADKFQIALPGTTGGGPVPVFTIDNVGGSPKVAMRADMLVDGSVTTQTINAGAVTAVEIATGTITSVSGVIGALSIESLSIGDNAATVPEVQNYSAVTLASTSSGGTTFATFNMSIDTTGLSGKSISIYAIATCMSNLNFNGGSNSLAFNLNINGTTVASTPGGSFQEQATTLSGSTTITGTGSVMSITVLVHGSILSAVSSTITGSLFAIAAKR